MQLVDILYELARQHKSVKAFVYNSVNEIGNGSELYPLFWLEDPLLGDNADARIIRFDFNFSITEIPEEDNQVKPIQDRCFRIGLAIIEKLRKINNNTLLSVKGFNFLTLRDYYDNKSAGIRFSVTVERTNPQNLCDLDNDFEEGKEFPAIEALPKFKTDNPKGCATFPDKPGLPKITFDK